MIASSGPLAGCLLTTAAEGIGKGVGRLVGTSSATAKPTPRAVTAKAEPKGGSFCGVTMAYRLDEAINGFSAAEVNALSGWHLGVLADLNKHGRDHCTGWKGP